MTGQSLTVLTPHDVSGILNSKVQSDNGSIFKAAVTQSVSKALGIEYHLHCSWRPQSSEKVEKANDIERLLLNENRRRDSWHLEEKNSIRGQRRGLIAQSFCVIKFY